MSAPTAFRWRIAQAGLLLATLLLGIYGIGRSLWLDEAWVANSVLAPNLAGMFYYPGEFQTTPPLFLLLTRAVVHVFGMSNAAFRLVPLASALVAVASMIALSKRLFSPPFAALACALLAFYPAVIEYSRTCKQYSGELAASAVILLGTFLYLRDPDRRRFYWLAGAFLLLLPMAWAAVFLLPGVAIVIWARGGMRRAASLVLAAGVLLAILYAVFIGQNLSAELRASYFIAGAQNLSPGLIVAAAFCGAAALRAAFLLKKRPDTRTLMQIVAVLPCVLLAVSAALHWYPASPRTRLFALPCFLLVLTITAEDLSGALLRWRPMASVFSAALWLTAMAVGATAAWTQISEHRNLPLEDLQGAVQLLRQHVGPSDLLLVHPSVLEGFKLYTAMEGWHDHHAIYGDTGWPCCRRDGIATHLASTKRAVSEDIDRMVPRGFTGRVWLFYSARHTHWVFAGEDEGILWRNRLWDRGCPPPARIYRCRTSPSAPWIACARDNAIPEAQADVRPRRPAT